MNIAFQKPKTPTFRPRERFKKPNRYCLVVYDDNFTREREAAWLLRKHFSVSYASAEKAARFVHQNGKVVLKGKSFSFDVAETKALAIMGDARKYYGAPLRVMVQKL